MARVKRILTILSTLIVLVLLISACAPAPAEEVIDEPEQEVVVEEAEEVTEAETEEEEAEMEPVEITYWHTMSDPETAKLDELIAVFEAANPGVTVAPTRFAYSDFKSAILTGLAGGAAPDTARMDIAWVPEFADQGALKQLDGVLEGCEGRLS